MKENHNKVWKKWQTDYLLENYDKLPTEEIAEHIGKTTNAVLGKRYSLGLKQNEILLHKLRATSKGAVARRRLYAELNKLNASFKLPKHHSISVSQSL